jgi:hypothetical protein
VVLAVLGGMQVLLILEMAVQDLIGIVLALSMLAGVAVDVILPAQKAAMAELAAAAEEVHTRVEQILPEALTVAVPVYQAVLLETVVQILVVVVAVVMALAALVVTPAEQAVLA